MRKLWKGVLLGAAVGGAVKSAQEVRRSGSVDTAGPAVAKAAAEAAVIGAVVGFVLDRRDRRALTRLQKMKAKAGMTSIVAGAGVLADAATKAAKPRIEAAAKAARPHVEKAADAARPRVEHAAEVARVRAQKATDAAKAKLADYDLPVLVAV